MFTELSEVLLITLGKTLRLVWYVFDWETFWALICIKETDFSSYFKNQTHIFKQSPVLPPSSGPSSWPLWGYSSWNVPQMSCFTHFTVEYLKSETASFLYEHFHGMIPAEEEDHLEGTTDSTCWWMCKTVDVVVHDPSLKDPPPIKKPCKPFETVCFTLYKYK